MANEYTIAIYIAIGIAIWQIAAAVYFVFLAERVSLLLMAVAFVKGLLGVGTYLVVRRPPWAVKYAFLRGDVLVPIVLGLFFLFSVLVTAALWQAYDLKPPQKRIRELLSTVTTSYD